MTNSSNSNDTSSSNNNVEYTSAHIVWNLLDKEYSYERDRKAKVESKASILFTLILAIQALLISQIKIPKNLDFSQSKTLIITIAIIILFFIIFCLFALTIFFLFKVIWLKDYKTLNISRIDDPTMLTSKENHVYYALLKDMKSVVIHNRDMNQIQSKNYQLALKSMILLFIFMLIGFSVIWIFN